ncbi:nickel pincer cofactor biosynthesis protein LarB [Aminipila sp.]|uniref:nickel pincer cofactor biosynthesis protein LarB n=1 Tax=Aminipila sp. TaxID=2060095 RepID=UPI00289F669E|nr:nickel pincer cofactor biosynthesis protein LarB [Aminipila sp.]
MNENYLKELLNKVAKGEVTPDSAVTQLKNLPFEDLGYVNIDHHRGIRTGFPEAVFCQGKTVEQVASIIERLASDNENIIGSRASREQFKAVKEVVQDAEYSEMARMICVKRNHELRSSRVIAVVTAGTSDIPVAEEAAVTGEMLGYKVDRIFDVGVAGIHRLFDKLERIRSAEVVIVAAGMEGALASVVGGLVDKPVIAVPTSIGYGANFGGLSALLAMLNSCANGIGVVNIDNGFGAAYLAAKMIGCR